MLRTLELVLVALVLKMVRSINIFRVHIYILKLMRGYWVSCIRILVLGLEKRLCGLASQMGNINVNFLEL